MIFSGVDGWRGKLRGPSARVLQRHSLSAVRRLGGYRALGASRWRRDRLLILCYHGISIDDEHLWNAELYMPPDRLERRLRTLRAFGCHVLPLGEALERLGRGDLPDRHDCRWCHGPARLHGDDRRGAAAGVGHPGPLPPGDPGKLGVIPEIVNGKDVRMERAVSRP
jgi:hypothetical protein